MVVAPPLPPPAVDSDGFEDSVFLAAAALAFALAAFSAASFFFADFDSGAGSKGSFSMPRTRRRVDSPDGSVAATKVAGRPSCFAVGAGAGGVTGSLTSASGTATTAATSSSATGHSLRRTSWRRGSVRKFIGR